MLQELGISPATLKRDLTHLRDRMNAPVIFDRELNGWRLDPAAKLAGTQYELPGLWLSADEIHALLTMQHLLAHLDAGGLLGAAHRAAGRAAAAMLGTGAPVGAEVARRIRVQTVGARKVQLPHFQAVGTALLRRQRLHIDGARGLKPNLMWPRVDRLGVARPSQGARGQQGGEAVARPAVGGVFGRSEKVVLDCAFAVVNATRVRTHIHLGGVHPQ